MTEIVGQKTISFGTDGIRGNAEHFPFTTDALFSFGQALGLWAQKKYKKNNPKFLIGSDTRISSPRIRQDLCNGLLSTGAVIVDAGVIPTPCVFGLISSDLSFDAGIVVSASHNPYQDNGIKVFDARHCKISQQDESDIVQSIDWKSNTTIQACTSITQWPQASQAYQQTIHAKFPAQFLKGIKVVLDCAHGATYDIAPALFRSFGAEVHILGTSPNGININNQCGALYPQELIKTVQELSADCGFAFDGDGDRVIAVNKHGVIKDGDDILALLLDLATYQHVSHVVGTIMTNQGFENHLNALNKTLIRTNVGDKYITAQLEANKLLLGGEASGHIIMKDYLSTGDGIFVALKVLESVIMNNNWDMKTFDKYPQILINVPVEQKKDLAQKPFASIISEHEKELGDGRLIVRYSGTENLLRVMTEASTYSLASDIAQTVSHKLQEALKAYNPLTENFS